mmetsp:Transcript_49657/g.151182  ORF Transcript_49657/g.151182 Transcript_49657/m.151182 type:complete len:280 (-) Transcript_49657:658-1497(-)
MLCQSVGVPWLLQGGSERRGARACRWSEGVNRARPHPELGSECQGRQGRDGHTACVRQRGRDGTARRIARGADSAARSRGVPLERGIVWTSRAGHAEQGVPRRARLRVGSSRFSCWCGSDNAELHRGLFVVVLGFRGAGLEAQRCFQFRVNGPESWGATSAWPPWPLTRSDNMAHDIARGSRAERRGPAAVGRTRLHAGQQREGLGQWKMRPPREGLPRGRRDVVVASRKSSTRVVVEANEDIACPQPHSRRALVPARERVALARWHWRCRIAADPPTP